MKIYGWRLPQSCAGAVNQAASTCPDSGSAMWWYWLMAAAVVFGWKRK